ncbi:hypothetical protein Y1Q_0019811 [Alligator mississippiensis]|uniref:Uncharacterized protein n=1 Tax=Alligator mississippiensis TaxID=8496 RepID=A0A151PFB7_ALLMI|nr:hypothetical protein Y1Q_0019811 [Alligator mississippiensis]
MTVYLEKIAGSYEKIFTLYLFTQLLRLLWYLQWNEKACLCLESLWWMVHMEAEGRRRISEECALLSPEIMILLYLTVVWS